MAKQSTPFFNLDFSQYMTEFDPTKMADEFQKMAKQYQLPGVDFQAIADSQRKNFEAVTTANKTALEGLQAVGQRQTEILQQTFDEISGALSQLGTSGSPQEAATKQADLAKKAFEKALADIKEVAEMVAKSNQDAAATINKRIAESLDEIKKLTAQLNK